MTVSVVVGRAQSFLPAQVRCSAERAQSVVLSCLASPEVNAVLHFGRVVSLWQPPPLPWGRKKTLEARYSL